MSKLDFDAANDDNFADERFESPHDNSLNVSKFTVFLISSLSIFANLKNDTVVSGIYDILSERYPNFEQNVAVYSGIYRTLVNSNSGDNISDYIFTKMLYDDNLYSMNCTKSTFFKLSRGIKNAVENELNSLSVIAGISSNTLKLNLAKRFPAYERLVGILPDFDNKVTRYKASTKWGDDIIKISESYRKGAYSIFSDYKVFDFIPSRPKMLRPLEVLNDAAEIPEEYQKQKSIIGKSIESLHDGNPKLNILMCGQNEKMKNTILRWAVSDLNKVKIVYVLPQYICDLDTLVDEIQNYPLCFVLCLEDVGNCNINAVRKLRSLTKAGMVKIPDNIVIYGLHPGTDIPQISDVFDQVIPM